MPTPEDKPFSVTLDEEGSTKSSRRERLGANSTDLQTIFRITDQAVGAVRAEMMGEIRALTAAMRENEAQRSMDVQSLTHALQDTPKLSEIKHENRVAIAWAVGIVIGLLALLWTVFGVGASTTSGFADHVIGVKEAQRAEQVRDLQIDKKLDQILKERPNGQSDAKPVRPSAEGNVVGNGT